MHKNHQPGLAVGIVYDGDLLWGKGYSFADTNKQTSVTLNTRFRIVGITKTFTATAILKLCDEEFVEQGKSRELTQPLD